MRDEPRSPEPAEEPSDEELMEGVQRGEDEAFDALFRRFRGRLFGFLMRRCSDPATAEDLFQETWLRVARSRHRYDPTRRFSTWLFQIANNLCRDRGRRREVEQRGKGAVMEAQAMSPAGGPAPADLHADVTRRLDALPERMREVVILRYYHDLPEHDVAEIVGIPQGTVKSRLHAAVQALRGAEERER